MKKSCHIDKRRWDSGWCPAHEDIFTEKYSGAVISPERCALGFKIKNGIPFEQCPKPKNIREYLRLFKEIWG
jgi:hypothetical protein